MGASIKIKWTDTGWAEILNKAISQTGKVVKVGWVGATAEEPHADSGLNNAEIATIQEFGSSDGHVPARAPLQNTFMKDPGRGRAKLAEGIKEMLKKGKPARTALRLTGKWGKKVLRAEMKKDLPPPNAESTIKKKGSDETLIDTGKLRDAVRYELADAKSSSGSEEEGDDE